MKLLKKLRERVRLALYGVPQTDPTAGIWFALVGPKVQVPMTYQRGDTFIGVPVDETTNCTGLEMYFGDTLAYTLRFRELVPYCNAGDVVKVEVKSLLNKLRQLQLLDERLHSLSKEYNDLGK